MMIEVEVKIDHLEAVKALSATTATGFVEILQEIVRREDDPGLLQTEETGDEIVEKDILDEEVDPDLEIDTPIEEGLEKDPYLKTGTDAEETETVIREDGVGIETTVEIGTEITGEDLDLMTEKNGFPDLDPEKIDDNINPGPDLTIDPNTKKETETPLILLLEVTPINVNLLTIDLWIDKATLKTEFKAPKLLIKMNENVSCE
jgi:hypothetical protein